MSSHKKHKSSKDGEEKKKSEVKNTEIEVEEAELIEETSGPFEQLEDELLVHIMNQMSHFQLFLSMRVNKRWLQAARSIQLTSFCIPTHFGFFEDEHLSNIISKHPKLESVVIHSAPRLTDKAIKILGKLASLTSLDLSNCRNLTDSSLTKLPSNICQNLTYLNVSHCSFSDRALRMGVMPALTHLDLSFCDGLSNRFVQQFAANYPALTTLDVSNSPLLGDDFVAGLASVPSLTSVSLRNCQTITHHGFLRLAPDHKDKLPSLKTLDISSTMINNDGLMKICSTYTQLTDLSFSLCHRIDDEGTANLSKLTSLQYLAMAFTGIGPKTLDILKDLPVKTISVSGCTRASKVIKDFASSNPKIRVEGKLTTIAPNQ